MTSSVRRTITQRERADLLEAQRVMYRTAYDEFPGDPEEPAGEVYLNAIPFIERLAAIDGVAVRALFPLAFRGHERSEGKLCLRLTVSAMARLKQTIHLLPAMNCRLSIDYTQAEDGSIQEEACITFRSECFGDSVDALVGTLEQNLMEKDGQVDDDEGDDDD